MTLTDEELAKAIGGLTKGRPVLVCQLVENGIWIHLAPATAFYFSETMLRGELAKQAGAAYLAHATPEDLEADKALTNIARAKLNT